MATKKSEGQAWDHVEAIGSGLLAAKEPWIRELARELMATAAEMRGQLKRGVHTNPLVIYGNPQMRVVGRAKLGKKYKIVGGELVGVMSGRVYEIRYRHMDDGKDYQHEFDPRVQMLAILRGEKHDVLLTHQDSLPLWRDF